MLTKNISVELESGKKVPSKEIYIVFSKSNKKIRLDQKFVKESNNQSITLNYEECRRLMNLLNFYVFRGEYAYSKDKMLKYITPKSDKSKMNTNSLR